MWRTLIAAGLLAAVLPGNAALAQDPAPSIIGGHDATERYSFMVSLQDATGEHKCGAALIRPDWVLTAAHCVADETPAALRFRIGSTKWSSGGTIARAKRILIHPELDADTALIQLTRRVPQTPIRIADAVPVGSTVRLLGWGCTQDPGCTGTPETLQQLDTTVLPDEDADCQTTSLELCLDNRDGWRGACYGDSGGPALRRSRGSWTLAGNTHGGPSPCATAPFYYGELPTIRPWIEATVGRTGPG